MTELRRFTRLFAPAAVALVAAGCAGFGGDDDGDDERRVTKQELKNLVLQPSDLSGYAQFDFGALTLADVQPGPRVDPQRFGRTGGWKARYRQTATAAAGPLIVESFVDLFGSDDGARRDLEAYRAQFEQAAREAGTTARLLSPPNVADGAQALVLTQAGSTPPIRFFTVAWRNGELTAAISVNGAEGDVGLDDAVALALKQDRRISAASVS